MSESAKLLSAKEHIQELEIFDLLQLKKFIDDVIIVKKDEAIQQAFQPLEELANTLNIPLDEMLPRKNNKRHKPVNAVVAYRSKLNPSNTWSGRGNRPKWLREELETGITLEELAI